MDGKCLYTNIPPNIIRVSHISKQLKNVLKNHVVVLTMC